MTDEQQAMLRQARSSNNPSEKHEVRARLANEACQIASRMLRLKGTFGIEVYTDKQAITDIDAVHRVLGYPTEVQSK